MIVDRFIFSVKLGHQGDVLNLIKADMERHHHQNATRLFFLPLGPPRGEVVVEHEFESYAESQKYWDEWGALPESHEFLKKLNGLLTDIGWRIERWELF